MGAWFGSKGTTAFSQAIVSMCPPHHTCRETHLGGGAIMKRKPPALRNIGIDLNRRAIGRFSCDCTVELHHGCCHAFLSGFDFQGDELVCADPPCVQSARRSPRRCRFDCSDDGHAELIRLLRALPARVMISGCPSRLHDEQLSDWRSISPQASNRCCVVTEKAWLSFPPGQPHWHSNAGRNFTERLSVLAAVMAVEAGQWRR